MANPKDIAKAFLDAYSGACASGNPASLAALYGPDSVLSLDGQVAEGAANINASVLTPRLSGGPIRIRWITFDAQFVKPTQQLVVFVTGEADARPAGRFSQVFLLNSIPSGGMYIRVDCARFGAGSVPENVTKDGSGLGKNFLGHYFQTYTSNKAAIAPLYRDTSSMCFEGTDHEGSAAINAKIPSLPSGQHAMTSFDSVTSISAPIGTVQTAVVALLSGQFKIEGEANPLAFAQAFVLVVDNGAPYCANDLFRFHYG